MRGTDEARGSLFSYVDLEALYTDFGRPSIPPERLIRASLIQILFSIRSERQLMEQMQYNLLFRWFVGLGIDDPVWVPTVFTKNRDRQLSTEMLRKVMAADTPPDDDRGGPSGPKGPANDHTELTCSETTPMPRPNRQNRNAEVDSRGEKRSNATHASTTDPDARLYKKSPGTGAMLCFMGHALMENRSGLIVQGDLTQADGHAKRRAALEMIHRHSPGSTRQLTLGADKGFGAAEFVADLRQACITPHIAQKSRHSAIDGRTTRHEGYALSIRHRKRIEEAFGWAKTVGGTVAWRRPSIAASNASGRGSS